jgi:hypothetical protein
MSVTEQRANKKCCVSLYEFPAETLRMLEGAYGKATRLTNGINVFVMAVRV